VALLWWKRDGWGRPLLFGFGYFVLMLFPVLGFFDQGFYRYAMVADHWQYYSIVGVTALAAAGAVALGRRFPRGQPQVIGLVAGLVVMLFVALSRQRCLVFRNQETLFQDNLLHNPLAWAAHCNLGIALARDGRIPEAIEHLQAALRIEPNSAEAHCSLGIVLARDGRMPEAMEHLQAALRIEPDFTEAQNALAQLRAGQ
jgi:tetratricopeptide (TPR) repeat protein